MEFKKPYVLKKLKHGKYITSTSIVSVTAENFNIRA